MVLNVYSWRPDYSTCSVDTAVGYVALRPALLHAYLGPHITASGFQGRALAKHAGQVWARAARLAHLRALPG